MFDLRRPGLVVLGIVLVSAGAFAQSSGGHLLVDNIGTVLLISPDGTQHPLASFVNQAVLSPDGTKLAFTTDTQPKLLDSTQKLVVMSISGGERGEIVELPQGAHFGGIGWRPDGAAIAYEAMVKGKSDDLYIAPVPPAKGEPRNLGHWYQGFSFSPDGKQLVHAVNEHETGLEVLDIASGKSALIYKSETIVWDARYSPDGKYIAYVMTLHEPERDPDGMDCTPPTLGLFLYSIEQKTSKQVTVKNAPGDDMKNFAWSPDGKHIALTLGATECDYPGSTAAVFLTDISQTHQVRLSTGDMAFEPAFSPDGSAVAFVDFSNSPAKLMRYTIASGKLDLIRQASPESNYYSLRDWK